ncbi:hypothetical protein C5167_007754 [Papaver somniferum]|uniref:chaperone protein dnaJ 20, chloroplastic-like n=1 Tax=Papaver somniferum TaxID=3469 RepID=UPI000E6FE346|nr:chaperone protein dnaJ 20, chloroplastic-like [Papaver somniferum]RZC85142.1 hypothetical protein C5167_007754 [Papaver somniferum]
MEVSLALQTNIGKLDFLSKGSENLFNKRYTISCRVNNHCNSIRIERETNFYEVLSLDSSKNVGYEDIKKAYRRMALQYHPDICPDPSRKQESTERFVELRKAYETLSDPVSRYNYDHQLGLSVGIHHDSAVMHPSKFTKEVWENQLSGLKRRSQNRMQRKQKNSRN